MNKHPMAFPRKLGGINFSESVSSVTERKKKEKDTLTPCENIDRHDRHSKKDPES